MNYVVYHLHTYYSLLDSTTSFYKYVDKAKELGMTSIGCTEHGNIYGWYKKKQYAEKNGLKFLFGIECYLTESHENKIRDNYHTILIAKNKKGMEELCRLYFISTQKDHVYFKPRLSFDEFLNISNNIIKISACIQSPLEQYRKKNNNLDILDKLLKHYDYYEIQYHNYDWQIKFNQYLYTMSKKYNKPLIVGTDTHSLNTYEAECRVMLQYGKTENAWGSEESKCDLTFKTYDELIDMFKIQNSLPLSVITEAIDNTNKMADSVEYIELDTNDKYPLLYGEDDEKVLKNRLNKKFKEKIKRGEIKISDKDKYVKAVKEEMAVFKKINMVGFMLFMSEIISWAKDNDIYCGFARGSCSGSCIAYLSDITDVDPLKWNTVFSRFANENRVEAGDIDTDWYEDDRPKVYDYIINRFGSENTAYILALGTLADKAVIDMLGKAFRVKAKDDNQVTQYTLEKIEKIKKEWDNNKENTRQKYNDLFYYYDGLVGCVISQSQHPAGILVSPINLIDNVGAFYGKDNQIIVPIDMDECHDLGLIKFDILGLKSIGVISKTFKLINKKFPKAYEIDWNDEKVFKDISNDSSGIFQFESDFAKSSIKKMQPRSVEDLSLCSACLRPSGESYRDAVFNHEVHKNPSPLIDKILSNSNGFLVYQEETIAFLQQICGFSGSDADSIRRAIGKKNYEKIAEALPQIVKGYCSKSDKPKEIAEQEVKDYIKVIEDASGYSFGYNHSIAYAMISYLMGWLRYYYPIEFCVSYLNCAKNDDDIIIGTSLIHKYRLSIMQPRFRYSTDEYNYDLKSRIIFKGLESVKYINKSIAKELYNIRNFKGDIFDLFDEISKMSIDKRQINVLIYINFFKEFGSVAYLLSAYDIYCKYRNRKQLSIDESFNIPEQFIDKKTEKTIYLRDTLNLCREIKKSTPNPKIKLAEILKKEKEFLGYCITQKKCDLKYYFVVEQIKDNKFRLYNCCDGSKIVVKVRSKILCKNPIKENQIIRVNLLEKEGKWIPIGKDKSGKMQFKQLDEKELILKVYEVKGE